MRSRVLLLFWKAFQPRNSSPWRYSTACAALNRNFHCTSFNFTRETDKNVIDDRQQPGWRTGDAGGALIGGSKYNALMDAARTKSQLSNREQFGLVLKEFMSREKYRKGHVAFINMALERMEEFQLEKDLLTYNRLLDIFPKGRFKPKRLLDALWPRPLPQTELALELLTRMEDNDVWPDGATYSILIEVFGRHSLPVEKCERMIYWYERYKDSDPYWITGEVPSDLKELSKIALKRIVHNGSITEHQVLFLCCVYKSLSSWLNCVNLFSQLVSDSPGFILSGHTVAQLQVLDQLNSSQSVSGSTMLYVEGPHRIWINKSAVHYFSLQLSATDSGPNTTEGR